VLLRHTLRNSAGAALSMTGLQVGLMFAGVVVIESIFAWPGIGFYTVQSIPNLDFPAIAGVTTLGPETRSRGSATTCEPRRYRGQLTCPLVRQTSSC